MKYNLKNHPPVDPRNCELENWFEDFEKELREKLSEFRKIYPNWKDNLAKISVKEILGDNAAERKKSDNEAAS